MQGSAAHARYVPPALPSHLPPVERKDVLYLQCRPGSQQMVSKVHQCMCSAGRGHLGATCICCLTQQAVLLHCFGDCSEPIARRLPSYVRF